MKIFDWLMGRRAPDPTLETIEVLTARHSSERVAQKRKQAEECDSCPPMTANQREQSLDQGTLTRPTLFRNPKRFLMARRHVLEILELQQRQKTEMVQKFGDGKFNAEQFLSGRPM